MLVLGDFSDLKKKNNYNSNWKKIMGFRNKQEKLKNFFTTTKKRKLLRVWSEKRPVINLTLLFFRTFPSKLPKIGLMRLNCSVKAS